MDNCMDAWMVNDEGAAWMDERMDGWSDEYGDDDYDPEPLDEYGYDYNAYDDGHVRYTRVAFTLEKSDSRSATSNRNSSLS